MYLYLPLPALNISASFISNCFSFNIGFFSIELLVQKSLMWKLNQCFVGIFKYFQHAFMLLRVELSFHAKKHWTQMKCKIIFNVHSCCWVVLSGHYHHFVRIFKYFQLVFIHVSWTSKNLTFMLLSCPLTWKHWAQIKCEQSIFNLHSLLFS